MNTIEIKVGRRATGKSYKNLQDAYTHSVNGTKTFIIDFNEEYDSFSKLSYVQTNKSLNKYLSNKKDSEPKIYAPNFPLINENEIVTNVFSFISLIKTFDNSSKTIILEDTNKYCLSRNSNNAKYIFENLLITHKQDNINYILTFQSFSSAEKYLQYAHSIEIFRTSDNFADKSNMHYSNINKVVDIVKKESETMQYFSIKLDLTKQN